MRHFSSLVTVPLVLQDAGVGRAISLVLLPSLWVLQDGGGTSHFSSLLTVSQVLQDRGGTRHFLVL